LHVLHGDFSEANFKADGVGLLAIVDTVGIAEVGEDMANLVCQFVPGCFRRSAEYVKLADQKQDFCGGCQDYVVAADDFTSIVNRKVRPNAVRALRDYGELQSGINQRVNRFIDHRAKNYIKALCDSRVPSQIP